jgi:hypothetical protein
MSKVRGVDHQQSFQRTQATAISESWTENCRKNGSPKLKQRP